MTLAATAALLLASSAHALTPDWLQGARAPGTPTRFNRIGVLKVGFPRARNVLILVDGDDGGSTYWVPEARTIVARDPAWQVWAVERRENLFENQTELNRAKRHLVSAQQLYDYYLGYLTDPAITNHYTPVVPSSVEFAKSWGMDVLVGDLRHVIAAAHRYGGQVVLGGHSLGGSVVSNYATWDFGGHPGADGLAGLVFSDGQAYGRLTSVAKAKGYLAKLDAPTTSPFQTTPTTGIVKSISAQLALMAPDQQSPLQQAGLGAKVNPPVATTNLGFFGYINNAATLGPEGTGAHLGTGLSSAGPVDGWNGAGALTPIRRYANMLAGTGVTDADGAEWYFPARLLLDFQAPLGDGTQSPVQRVLGLHATLSNRLPHDLRMYAFAAEKNKGATLAMTRTLARRSHLPMSNLTLVNRDTTYAHSDPTGAFPKNAFLQYLLPFLRGIQHEQAR